MEAGLDAGAEGDGALPKRSVVGWEGPELDEAGGFEKAFQSPNSPFPLDDAAAGQKR